MCEAAAIKSGLAPVRPGARGSLVVVVLSFPGLGNVGLRRL